MNYFSLLAVLRAPALALAVTATALAIDVGPNDVYIRVVDVGPGLCTVTEVPGDTTWCMTQATGTERNVCRQ